MRHHVSGEGAIADFDGEGATRDFNNRCRLLQRPMTGQTIPHTEVLSETLRVDRRRGDDDFQIWARRKQASQIAQDEVNVQAAFVGLVNNQCVVATKQWIGLDFCQQNAVGHQFD
ncbi:Uncharacterised protein [Chlamydia trachomatis]|nr:Uncharacterised protein [Chlamydia trachomatis]